MAEVLTQETQEQQPQTVVDPTYLTLKEALDKAKEALSDASNALSASLVPAAAYQSGMSPDACAAVEFIAKARADVATATRRVHAVRSYHMGLAAKHFSEVERTEALRPAAEQSNTAR